MGVMLGIDELLMSLARRRPVFHSEADFQHEFAWEARSKIPDLRVRLEQPFPGRASGAIDIIFCHQGEEHAVELKYVTRLYAGEWDSEEFRLKNHGAQDLRSYDICKDIGRMEAFASGAGHRGSVVVLTNDPYYWKARSRLGTCADAFDISGARKLTGELAWADHTGAGTMRNREAPITLRLELRPVWKDYSDVGGKAGQFRYFQLTMGDGSS